MKDVSEYDAINSFEIEYLLENKDYYLKDNFQKELDSIFSGWLLAGLASEIPNHGDTMTQKIGNNEIILSNHNNKYFGLINTCSHRGAKIKDIGFSSSPLRCPYHSWIYDFNGDLKSIPGAKEHFPHMIEDKKCFGLERVQLETVGNFIFIAFNEQEKGLQDFLGPIREILIEISSKFELIKSTEYRWKTNWKTAVESVLEVYHINSVHPNTFKNFVNGDWNCKFYGSHSYGDSKLSPKVKKWWDNISKLLGLDGLKEHKEYNHYLIFPNIAIGITRGLMLSIQWYLPMKREKTLLISKLFMPKSSNQNKGLLKMAKEDAIKFNNDVLLEDQEISERVQSGVNFKKVKSLYSRKESRIYHFHSVIKSYLKNSSH